MNQASRALCVVPVLAATCQPSIRAREPVPFSTTFIIIQINCRAASSRITRSPIPAVELSISGSASPRTLRLTRPYGVTDDPPFRMPANAPVISINVLSDTPRAIAGPAAKPLSIPNPSATFLTISRPTSSFITTAGMFRLSAKAWFSVMGPLNSRS